jgi:hypothetical protein
VAGVKDIKDHLVWVEPVSGMAFDASYKEPTGTASPTGAASTDGQYAHCTSGEDFSLSQECIMKIRWALFSAAILIGFLPSQVTSEEAVLGQGNISCGSWIENRRDNNPLAATRTAWVLGFITAFNQYGAKPQRDVSGGKDTEVLMARIDDHCKRHPLDNLYKASAALVDELRQ